MGFRRRRTRSTFGAVTVRGDRPAGHHGIHPKAHLRLELLTARRPGPPADCQSARKRLRPGQPI